MARYTQLATLIVILVAYAQQVLAVMCPGDVVANPHVGWPNKCRDINEHPYYIKPPDHNGCGPRGATLYSTPEADRCCRAHDICYSTLGTTMGYCDQEFKACLDTWDPNASGNFLSLVAPLCPTFYQPAQNDYFGCRTFHDTHSYMGCFEDFGYQRVLPYWHKTVPWPSYYDGATKKGVDQTAAQNFFTVQSCRTECASRRFLYSGVEAWGECFCGNTPPTSAKKPESECSMPCKNDVQQLCGGGLRISVYKTGYMGCFNDLTNDRDLPDRATTTPMDSLVGTSGYVPVMCMAECQNKGYRYAAVQDGGECWCGNTYGKHGATVSDTSCNKPCQAVLETTANSRVSITCGHANANQVYDTWTTLSGYKKYSFPLKSSMYTDMCLEWNQISGGLYLMPCSSGTGTKLLQQFVWDGDFLHPLSDMTMCVDASGGAVAGAYIIVYPCNWNDNQKWFVDGDRFKARSNYNLCIQAPLYPNIASLQWCSGSPGEQGFKRLDESINFDLVFGGSILYSNNVDSMWLSVDPNTNYAIGRGPSGWDCILKTKYSQIYIDLKQMRIDTSKKDYATTEVLSGPNTCDAASLAHRVPYGTASSCLNSGEVTSMIDLSGTVFRAISAFSAGGWVPHGSVAYSNNARTLTISGGGYCGRMATVEANAAGEEAAILWGGLHIAVDMPRQNVVDLGYSNRPHGWYDIQEQGQGRYNDYCRFVGDSPNIHSSCALGGSSDQNVMDGIPASLLGHFVISPSECLMLYKDCNFEGESRIISGEVSSFFDINFNDMTSGFRVAPGCTATLCTATGFEGCFTYKNDVACLGNLNNDVFSSAKCTCP